MTSDMGASPLPSPFFSLLFTSRAMFSATREIRRKKRNDSWGKNMTQDKKRTKAKYHVCDTVTNAANLVKKPVNSLSDWPRRWRRRTTWVFPTTTTTTTTTTTPNSNLNFAHPSRGTYHSIQCTSSIFISGSLGCGNGCLGIRRSCDSFVKKMFPP